jgi:hypothetical protein
MTWGDIEGFSLQKMIEAVRPRTFSVGKSGDTAQAMMFLHNSRARYITTVLSHDKPK